ncbi:cytochrome c oxidase subunit II [Hahella aquimaris]|uniref:cytochrome c oxidase subunit II n=1 Tax=Hahella sp. HNIBRBA332 TaxID=3015983 RepID=UPI00273C5319|nr:cytochrome c oxidase subunit II [Hahella sp. HNIBRBA332]WLQ13016.1 cytochrome c oxidase subunit II [Hahella sp. HNIBRBA332]
MMSRRRSIAVASPVPFVSASASAAWELNMTPGVSEVSQSVYSLHMTIFWICVIIGIVVFGVMFWSIFNHRKSKGAKPAQFHESTTVEIIWTVIPFLILIGMAIPATGTLVKMYDASEADMDIKITGYQWKWRYEYLNQDVNFFSNLATSQDQIYNRDDKGEHYLLEVDEPLVLPINKKIRFLVTSADVIHSWWVPSLAVKRDAIPGYVREAWTIINEPGIYRGQCAELCGKDHGFMPVVVKAVPEEEYQEWLLAKQELARQEYELKNKEWTMEELVARGEKTYASSCAVCHQANGAGLPPTFPSLIGSSVVKGPIEKHAEIVLHGVPGTAMQAFGAQLSEVDIAAIVTYERNAWGNNMGDMITPQQVAELKNK